MMTEQQLSQLRSEIVLNSLYIDDYKNSFNIPEQCVASFFETYYDDLFYYYAEAHGFESFDVMVNERKMTGTDVADILNGDEFWELDNSETLYRTYCKFEDDPLPVSDEDEDECDDDDNYNEF